MSNEENSVHMGEIVRTLDRIEKQVVKTNGRVSALEKWRWIITGGIIVLGAMSVPGVSLIAKAFAGI
jgi:hypothetical protein